MCNTWDVLQVHGNVCLASVVVTPTLDWKLHGLGVLSEFDGGNPHAAGPMLVSLPDSPISEFWHCQSELRKVCYVRKTSVVAVIVNLLLVNVENEHGLYSATNTIGWLGHNTRLWSWVRVTGLLSASLPHGHWTLGDLVSIQ
jgi:hypothetical protein